MTPPWQGADEALFRLIHLQWRHPILDPFFRDLTDPGKLAIPLILVLLGFLWIQRRRGFVALCVLIATIAAADQMSAKVLKPMFGRARPWVAIPEARPFFGERGSYSFPSVHATNSMAGALVLGAVFPGARLAFVAGSVLIGYSRVYTGDHYPSDVLAGWILGFVIGWGGRRLFFFLAARLPRGAELRRVGETPSAAP